MFEERDQDTNVINRPSTYDEYRSECFILMSDMITYNLKHRDIAEEETGQMFSMLDEIEQQLEVLETEHNNLKKYKLKNVLRSIDEIYTTLRYYEEKYCDI